MRMPQHHQRTIRMQQTDTATATDNNNTDRATATATATWSWSPSLAHERTMILHHIDACVTSIRMRVKPIHTCVLVDVSDATVARAAPARIAHMLRPPLPSPLSALLSACPPLPSLHTSHPTHTSRITSHPTYASHTHPIPHTHHTHTHRSTHATRHTTHTQHAYSI